MNLFNIPPGVPFLDAVAAEWLDAARNDPLVVSQGLILLPTRRAARALADAFLRASGGRPLLLPRITAFGALDEAPLELAGALDLPRAVEPARRLAALTRLVLAMQGRNGAPQSADRAWPLAAELAALMDEAEREEIDLATKLPDAADPAFAAHWSQTLEFLEIVTRAWPDWLADQGLMNPAAHQVALLDAQAAAWKRQPPAGRVLVAGATGGIPAVARLLRVVAEVRTGAVVFAGLDLGLPDEVWAELPPVHPQAGLARLLQQFGATRGDVNAWPSPPPGRSLTGRSRALSLAMLPAQALAMWPGETPEPIDGMSSLVAADEQEEATAVALVLRGALETSGATAALVTPDRDLARRVSAALLRHGIVADDSAGEALAETPPAVFLRLLVRAIADDLAPVPLLALLKHPLTAAGMAGASCRAAARNLEATCLRGPRPTPGLPGLRRGVRGNAAATGFVERLEACLEPVLRLDAAVQMAPAEAFAAVIEAGELLATTDELPGPARLWAGEEGEALATRLADIQAALPMLPDQRRSVLPGLLDAVLEGAVVRSRRALRGRDGVEHPRVFIWGLLEARLQSADTIVLGGLAEGTWPPATDPGPWLSRPMRAAMGLASIEERIGDAAHDFTACACAAPTVVLSHSRRRNGAPVVPARWLIRLETLLVGHGLRLEPQSAVTWARALDQPVDGPCPVRPPRPCPPVALRPRRLSVTEIETWLRDPYAVYARHVLRLRPLRPLDEATDAADYGSLVHAGMAHFISEFGPRWPADAGTHVRRAMARALAEAELRSALVAWWAPRLDRIADWIADIEAVRRSDRHVVTIAAEVSGTCDYMRPGGTFRLTGRADRIERRSEGSLAVLDYKTGTPPSQRDVDMGLAPQLLLEAAMLEAGAFGDVLTGQVDELIYWHLTGGYTAGESRPLFKSDPAAIVTAIAEARDALCSLIDAYDAPDRCYLSQPQPGFAPRFSHYAQLARVAEWTAAGDDA